MASVNKSSSQKSLEIKTKSIEATLVPLVTQISTLVNFKEKPRTSLAANEKTLQAINRVGEAVHLAVERFVSVGESIANENPEIKSDLIDACREARSAGESIKRITCVEYDTVGKPICITDRQSMIHAARSLLSAVTRVLLLADMVVVKQIVSIKKKVMSTLNRLEAVTSFSEFIKLFAIYGSQMVELAHLTGDRQNDLKDERRRSQLSASRTILEKSTMLILTSSKTYLRHIECHHSRQCRDLVYDQIRHALEMVGLIVYDSGSTTQTNNPTLTLMLTKDEINFVKSLRQFEYAVEMLNVSVTSSTKEQLQQLCSKTIDNSQDFTDSIYISIEQREKLLEFHKNLQEQLAEIIEITTNTNDTGFSLRNDVLPLSIQTIQQLARNFRKHLEQMALYRASEFFRTHDENVLLNEIKTYSLAGRLDLLQEAIDNFREQADIAIELSKLLKHISACDQLQVSSEYHDLVFQNLSNMIIASAQSVAAHSTSRVPKENLDVLCRFWEQQINDFSILVKEIQDVIEGRGEKNVYLSLPRPGKHGTTSKAGFKPTKLDSDEQAKIAKAGLEMKLVTSEMDAEAEKWDEPQSEIAKRAKNMSSMAFSMYLFTRGEGTLRTTQDLFTQAYYFVEEGARLSAIAHEFANQIPNKNARQDILTQLERIPLMCHQLKLKLKTPVSGKISTFSKVDTVICETRDLMNAVARLCTNVFVCQSKYSIVDYRTTSSNHNYVRPPVPSVKWNRTTTMERDDRMESKPERTMRSSSLQRPSNYLPNYDCI
ncbi:unnamed protein product [Rotaria magnacalcarata]|uniref:Alpha-catulin n=10 Tax=Rotaria magnacalcarata TaxID=392030 RepID=A0A819QSJ7_9BILA|nr:unnamed protein product [Rotaria magnacalcarata]CAF1956242.1 unnamed protein product [Rotaria magnacalcarata]CAF2159633.1 unnamed protein product [Rotaria magnacalcarata]CAF4040071.1 unnamed protein product [Rotaria magnacalcarata]CAF4143338.1 unnamed protein product [Rotaria magnacalcarata]